MGFFHFKNVRIAGVAAGVPKTIVRNEGDAVQSADYDADAFVALTGVQERRISHVLTTADLCYHAAEKLIADLGWEKSEIGAIVFVSQSPDYILPASACILQDRLGLSKECYACDVSLGCSGWVYGLSQVAALLAGNAVSGGGGCRKALVLAGDAKLRYLLPPGDNSDPLFGHAGTATAIEYSEGAPGLMFHMGTDGSGYDAIIIPDGGARNPFRPESYELLPCEGKKLHRLQTWMKGMDVFAFGITTAPKSVRKLAEHFQFHYLDYDYFIFHQANMKMNNMVAKKLKLPPEKVPSSMFHFGNTSSASIPMTMVSELKDKADGKLAKYLCCGFGVGLSWGTVAFEDAIHISSLVEVDDNQVKAAYSD